MTQAEIQALAQKILDERGYLVVATPWPREIGEVLPALATRVECPQLSGDDLEAVTVVTKATDVEDWAAHLRAAGRPMIPVPPGWFFYRVVAE